MDGCSQLESGSLETRDRKASNHANGHKEWYCLEEAGRLYQHKQRATEAQEQREDAYRGIVEGQTRRARSTGSGRVCGCGV